MEKQHLTYFKIENFKRFDSFEMSNLGQFNLIVGDNNVGKTSVLEALTFDEDVKVLLYNYISVLFFREGETFSLTDKDIIPSQQRKYWEFMFKEIDKPIHISFIKDAQANITLEIIEDKDLSQHGRDFLEKFQIYRGSSVMPNVWISVSNKSANDAEIYNTLDTIKNLRPTQNLPFIPASSSYGSDLVNNFYEHFNNSKSIRNGLEEQVKTFIPNLEEMRPYRITENKEGLGFVLNNSDKVLPITRYGEGTIRFIRILMKTLLFQNKRIMVDEISTGVHFTRLKDFWKRVIKSCIQYNVQLFATTHSLECQQAFIEALEDPEMQQYQKDARNISLIEDKQGDVKAITYDFEQFEYALNIGFNTRGGKA